MRLGARWRAGDPPHMSVPEVMHATISEQEAAHPDATSWTITWLEGRPYCDLDGAVIVRLTAEGTVVASPPHNSGEGAAWHAGARDSEDDDDDDWLS